MVLLLEPSPVNYDYYSRFPVSFVDWFDSNWVKGEGGMQEDVVSMSVGMTLLAVAVAVAEVGEGIEDVVDTIGLGHDARRYRSDDVVEVEN